MGALRTLLDWHTRTTCGTALRARQLNATCGPGALLLTATRLKPQLRNGPICPGVQGDVMRAPKNGPTMSAVCCSLLSDHVGPRLQSGASTTSPLDVVVGAHTTGWPG